MLRTVIIDKSKLEGFLSELAATRDAIREKGGRITVNDKDDSIEFEGVVISLEGAGPYLLKIRGKDEKAEDIEYLAEIFSKYKLQNSTQ